MCVLILLQSVLFGFELDDTPPAREGEVAPSRIEASMGWYIVDIVFALIFVGEFLLKWSYMGAAYFKDTMNIFDFALVCAQIFDIAIATPFMSGANLGILKVIRMIRVVRLARLVRLLKFLPQLYFIVSGVGGAFRSLFWAVVLLTVMLYTVSIYMTLTIGQNDIDYNPYYLQSGWDHEKYFGTVPRSMLSLFVVTTRSLWAETIVRHVTKVLLSVDQKNILFLLSPLPPWQNPFLRDIVISYYVLSKLSILHRGPKKRFVIKNEFKSTPEKIIRNNSKIEWIYTLPNQKIVAKTSIIFRFLIELNSVPNA